MNPEHLTYEQKGSIRLYSDKDSTELTPLLQLTEVKLSGSILSEHNREALMAAFQIPLTTSGTIYGFTADGVKSVLEHYRTSSASFDFAIALLESNKNVLNELVEKKVLRSAESEGETIYFPTAFYFKSIGAMTS